MNVKQVVKKVLYGFSNKVKISGSVSKHISRSAILKKCKITVCGNENAIEVSDNTNIYGCTVFVCGNNNKIVIGKSCTLKGVTFWIEGDNNSIVIGDCTTAEQNTHIAAVEAQSVTIGKDCMISSEVHITTTDSHSIVDGNGDRINAAKSIFVSNHVWIGYRSIILKGSSIAPNSVIGAASCISKAFLEQGVVIAGIPGKVIKNSINWKRERI